MKVHVAEVPWQSHGERLRKIREIVFVVEQNVPAEEEWDGLDEGARHFLAVNEAGQDLGCARLLPSGQIGRMAVSAESRGTGIGGQLLEAAVTAAAEGGLGKVFLHAQTHALGFYEAHGFLAEGDMFHEAGIEHRSMSRLLPLSYPQGASPVTAPEVEPPPQSLTAGRFFDGEAQAVAALCQGIDAARRQLCLYSQMLDPTYFDQAETVAALSAFARRARTSEVQVLIQSSAQIVSRGHRLIELARRLPSKIEVRLTHPDHDAPDTAFIAWDNAGYWRLPNPREPAGVLRTDDAVRARKLSEQFEQLWRLARQDSDLRVLRL